MVELIFRLKTFESKVSKSSQVVFCREIEQIFFLAAKLTFLATKLTCGETHRVCGETNSAAKLTSLAAKLTFPCGDSHCGETHRTLLNNLIKVNSCDIN